MEVLIYEAGHRLTCCDSGTAPAGHAPHPNSLESEHRQADGRERRRECANGNRRKHHKQHEETRHVARITQRV